MKTERGIFKKIVSAAASAVVAVTSVFTAVPQTVSAADNDYYKALAMSLYMYDANACGSGITDGPLTWRGDCHTYDGNASVGSLSGSARSAADPDGDGKVDLSGGFHDAGDHIKFNLTIGFGINSLALSEYLNPGIYEKAACKDHLIYELKWGADYLMKTTFLDGSGNVAAVAHVVANGDTDHGIWSAPEVQTYTRDVYWLTPGGNNSAVCCEMAAGLAGTAYVVKDSDPEYADKCLKYSKALLAFGQKYVGNEGGGLASFYGTDAQYQDEEAMAQAWLWINNAGTKPSYVPKNGDYGNSLYDGWVYCWNKVWQGYAAMMYKATGDQVFADELKTELQKQGDLTVGTYNASGWGASRYNCAKQMDAIALANGDKDATYAKAAKYQMEHILGDNSLGYSFLLGYGSKWPVHIHHRAANPGTDSAGASSNPSAKYTAYGLLVGGDDTSGYQDQTDKYQYTEGALDYNGCFAIACAGIANLYGGDPESMPALAKQVSEINADFKFGSSEPVTTTTVTEPTTTTTTTATTTSEPVYTITLMPTVEVQEILAYPTKTEYTVGEELDFSGLSVKARTVTPWQQVNGNQAGYFYGPSTIYDDVWLYSAGATLTGENGAEYNGKNANTVPAGRYTLSFSDYIYFGNGSSYYLRFQQDITYKDNSVTTTTTTVTKPLVTITMKPSYYVMEVLSYPAKTTYTVGEELDLSGVSVKVRSRTYWQEAEGGSEAGIIYGEPFIVENITLDPRGANIVGENGAHWNGENAGEIPAGSYMLMYSGTYFDGSHDIDIDLKYSVAFLKEEDKIKPYTYVITVADKETDERINNAVVTFAGTITYKQADGREIYAAPAYIYNTADGNPIIHDFSEYKDADGISFYGFNVKAEGYIFNEDDVVFHDGGSEGAQYVYIRLKKAKAVAGDANCDGQVDMSDAVLIMQSICNPNKYGVNGTDAHHITEQGKTNGDVDRNGLTNQDASSVQKFLLGIIADFAKLAQ
ncbi:MAG: glycoside hydrolase family 9 protein [Ruminococcus sp.]|nr:glycoside hydrolase family 9 protein [Ruminococcus sp.]